MFDYVMQITAVVASVPSAELATLGELGCRLLGIRTKNSKRIFTTKDGFGGAL